MGNATSHYLVEAERLPQGDLVQILLKQHARIRELCASVASTSDSERKAEAFDALRALLAVHESTEELVVRPRTRIIAGAGVADQRKAEERVAARALTELEAIPVDTAEFDAKFADFATSIARHAEAEETKEFTCLLDTCDETERGRLGAMLLQGENMTSRHPPLAGAPAKQWTARPFASLLDHAQEVLGRVTRPL